MHYIKVDRTPDMVMVSSIWDLVEIDPLAENFYRPIVDTVIVNRGKDFYEYPLELAVKELDLYSLINKFQLLTKKK